MTAFNEVHRRMGCPAGAIVLVLLIGLTSGCVTTPTVKSDYDSTVNLKAYKTFTLLQPRASGSATDPGSVMRLTPPAQEGVREVLTAKGLTEAPADKADCAVLVRGESMTSVSVTDWGYTGYPYAAHRAGWVYPYGGGYSNVDVRETTERKLIIEIYDSASHKMSWVGWAERSSGGAPTAETVKEAIRLVLAQFPPM
jgi:Domain of unknown function (DUF4136)